MVAIVPYGHSNRGTAPPYQMTDAGMTRETMPPAYMAGDGGAAAASASMPTWTDEGMAGGMGGGSGGGMGGDSGGSGGASGGTSGC